MVPSASSGLQRRATTELFKDAGVSLTNFFLKVLVKKLHLDPLTVDELTLKDNPF